MILCVVGVGEVGDTGGRPWFFLDAVVPDLMRQRFVADLDLGASDEPAMIAASDGGVADGGEPRAWTGRRTRASACGSTWGPSFPFSLSSDGAWSASEEPL
jgi:hypothetical protein